MPVSRALPCLLLALLTACASLEPLPDLPDEFALPPGSDSPLDKATSGPEATHAGQSAFRLVAEGHEAFITRVQSARMATRSLDIQTYIWHADLTGKFLVQQVLDTADRGVRVRLLLDDMDARAKNVGFAALAAHPNIDVRMFNPLASREGKLRSIGEAATSARRINRRMHNKSWIADNRIAIAGGRNVGDEYFGASDEVNFVDLDFAMIGPVVRDASVSFDKYWNSPSAYPMELLDEDAVSPGALEKLRGVLSGHAEEVKASRYAQLLRSDDAVKRLVAGDWPLEWSSGYQFLSDDPLKVTMQDRDAQRAQVAAALAKTIQATETQLLVISPYFVPGKTGSELLVKAAQSKRNVRVLTNSLVATDVAAVHGGYSRYRPALLEGGVQLWELKPLPGSAGHSSIFGSQGASLHTKALATDERTLFVGSYNLDPRSTWLNCEQGVLVENATLARQLADIFETQAAGERAWNVTLEEGDLEWSDGSETFDSDPRAGAGRRFQAWLARVLHLDAQL
jgi:cardiolipin synthase C